MCSGRLLISVPSNKICPDVSFNNPEIIFNKVDLPVPLLPTMHTNSPSGISIESLFKTVLSSPHGFGKVLVIFLAVAFLSLLLVI